MASATGLTRPMAEVSATERALTRLREAGGRVTKPRRAIVSALVEAHDHVTAEDLERIVRDKDPSIHLTTVYRTLVALERLGIVTHVHLGHGRAIYHLNNDTHYHLLCEGCGAIQELNPELLAPVEQTIAHTYDFKPRLGHFALVGLCRRCQEDARAPDGLNRRKDKE